MIFFIRIKVYRYLTLICHLMKMFYSAGAASPSQSFSFSLPSSPQYVRVVNVEVSGAIHPGTLNVEISGAAPVP